MLMEIIRARVHESAIAAAAAELLRLGASVNATNSEGLSPLIMASARGLPKVVKLLLAHGAWLGQRGLGRFRLADTRQSIRGRMSAQEFVSALLEAEARIPRDGEKRAGSTRTVLAPFCVSIQPPHKLT